MTRRGTKSRGRRKTADELRAENAKLRRYLYETLRATGESEGVWFHERHRLTKAECEEIQDIYDREDGETTARETDG